MLQRYIKASLKNEHCHQPMGILMREWSEWRKGMWECIEWRRYSGDQIKAAIEQKIPISSKITFPIDNIVY